MSQTDTERLWRGGKNKLGKGEVKVQREFGEIEEMKRQRESSEKSEKQAVKE